jgi:hypothetical protein
VRNLKVAMCVACMIAAVRPASAIDYSDDTLGYAAKFPTPKPPQLYRMKFESVQIKQEGFKGWKSGLPVYGNDLFVVECFELNEGMLRNKTDLEIVRILFANVDGIEKLTPKSRKVGVAETEGFELTIQYADGRRERSVCARIDGRFFKLSACCADSQPGVPPDPFPSDFILSNEVDEFFNSFKLTRKSK